MKTLKKLPSKVAYLWQFGFFSLCSPDCPKQPIIENSYQKCGSRFLCLVLLCMGPFFGNFFFHSFGEFYSARSCEQIHWPVILLSCHLSPVMTELLYFRTSCSWDSRGWRNTKRGIRPGSRSNTRRPQRCCGFPAFCKRQNNSCHGCHICRGSEYWVMKT